VKQVSYSEKETVYAAGANVQHARTRGQEQGFSETPRDAWEALPYFDREETPKEFEVFKFVTDIQVSKVDPPYQF
jgi:hypothetical protein